GPVHAAGPDAGPGSGARARVAWHDVVSDGTSYVQVAVPLPVDGLFTYRLPAGAQVAPGCRVQVPFGPRRLVGLVVLGPTTAAPAELGGRSAKAVLQVLDREPVVDPLALKLAGWISDYYLAPPGECYALLLPPRLAGTAPDEIGEPKRRFEERVKRLPIPGPAAVDRLGARMEAALAWLEEAGEAPTVDALRAATGVGRDVVRRLEERGLVAVERRAVHRDPFEALEVSPDTAPALTDAQAAAVARVSEALGGYRGFLLHGVTGSGKTEVYLAAIGAALARGQGALVLVPEIALTPQLVARFRARLGDRVAVQHSGLDPEARHEQWRRVAAGELPVVIGARSALFAPIRDLGLIIVDEEHEPSFKQDTSPRYHARDLALVRGHLAGAPVVLGSATPSAESWANVERGKLDLVRLADRVLDRPMPRVEVVDLRTAPYADPERLFSVPLLDAIRETVAERQQVILFLNRRGFASFLLCQECGAKLDCAACSVTYTWHRHRNRLVCHLCDESRPRPAVCPTCGKNGLKEVGFGTEQVEARLAELLPDARLARMDRDTTRGRALERLLTRFRRGDVDVLIGTQMVAKGHDFPNVTLVGVLLAELGLGFPDFRASERTFQLMTQIAGRAGRADKPGRVLIQTYLPEQYAIRHAVDHDTRAFLAEELPLRAARRFPPATHLALFRLSGKDPEHVGRGAVALERALAAAAAPFMGRVRVLPAQPAPIEKVKHRWRFQVLVNAEQRGALHHVLTTTRPTWSEGRLAPGVQVGLDIDPLSFL
ncbi:MAG: primosomal protein N', partial [Deltaproteobacteria bacterium]